MRNPSASVGARLWLATLALLALLLAAPAGAQDPVRPALRLTVDPPSVTVAENTPAVFTFTLHNDGPVAAHGVITAILPSQLIDRGEPSAGTFDAGSAQWSIPELAAGTSATLRVTAHYPYGGASTPIIAQTGFDERDPYSTSPPKAEGTIRTTPGLPVTHLAIHVTPQRDLTPPFTFTMTGHLIVAPKDRFRGWCSGTARASILTNAVIPREIAHAFAPLRLRRGRCGFPARRLVVESLAAVGDAPSLSGRARFPGNARLRPALSVKWLLIVTP